MNLGFRVFSYALLIVAAASQAIAADRVALVIGNSAYKHATTLKNPENDANALAAVLGRLGFEVIKGVDLDHDEFGGIVRKFARTVRGADVALLFYAGHALQVNGRNYLAPIDAKLSDEADLDFETLPLRTILKQMERETRTNLVFLDACRDNPLARNLARSMGTRSASVGRGLARVDTGVGTLIAFATEPDNVALDGSGTNSPFTDSLLKHIETRGLDVDLMLRRVRKDVLAKTSGRQVPWTNSSLTGRFEFVSGQTAVELKFEVRPTEGLAIGTAEPTLSAAAEAWSLIKDSEKAGDLEAFIKAFPDSFYAKLASTRLKELREQEVAVDNGATRPITGYSRSGSYACFGGAVFPDRWRSEATCLHFGCNFGRLSRRACLALGAKKNSRTVIHGNKGGGRSNECWLQRSCRDLRPHGDFTLFRRRS